MTIYANKPITLWTDYPLLGDDDHSLKEVTLRSFDENKYCMVKYLDFQCEVKAGYLLRSKEDFNEDWDCRVCMTYAEVIKLLLSRKMLSAFNKAERKSKGKVHYEVSVDEESHYNNTKFKSLYKAIRYLGRVQTADHTYVALHKETGVFNSESLTDYDYGYGGYTVWVDNGRPTMKARHIGKEPTYKQWRK